jgi:hypothetical protein
MTTSLSTYKTNLATAQNNYLIALGQLYAALIDLEALAICVQNIGGGAQVRFSTYSADEWQNIFRILEHPMAAPKATNFAGAIKASSGTLTSSPTLNVAAVPAWVQAGMVVTDLTTNQPVGTVSSATVGAATITLTANAANAVTTGDILGYSMIGRVQDQINKAAAGYIANWSGS